MSGLALITGATSGIGKALAHLLASKQISLILTGRNEQELQALKNTLAVPVIIHAADLTKKRSGLITLIKEHSPNLIINCAGYGLYGDILSHTLEEQMDSVELDLKAAMELTIEGARTLIVNKRKGTILNVSSAAAFFIYPTFALYAASKKCLLEFSLAFDEEVKEQGVRILTCCPGPVSTQFRSRASHGYPQRNDPMAISADRAAELIWKQIQKQQVCKIIDWKMACIVMLTRLIPKRLLAKCLKSSLKNRHAPQKP